MTQRQRYLCIRHSIRDYRLHQVVVTCSFMMFLVFGTAHSADSRRTPCASFNTARDVLECAMEQHPSVRKMSVAQRQSDLLEEVAKQRPNPELDTQFGVGESLGDTLINTDTTLAFTLELGGKRDARISRAQAEKAKALSDLQATRETVALDIVETLHRLRQIIADKSILEEALSAFRNIISSLKTRRHRSPEQDVSFVVYDTARSEYLLHQSALDTEERILKQKIEFATGMPFSGNQKLLPSPITNWPTLKDKPSKIESAAWKRAGADVRAAESEYDIARSESWSNLRIGPNFQTDTQGPLTVQTYGLSLSFPLPLFNLNGAGRAYALKGIDQSQIALETTAQELQTEYAQAMITYSSAVKTLRSIKTLSELERGHRHIESLMERGLVQSSLVIEAHRQIHDFTSSFHEQELAAIKALWRVYQIEGRISGEVL